MNQGPRATSLLTAMVFCVGMAAFAHAQDSPLKVEIDTTHVIVKNAQSFEVNTKIRNNGGTPQTVRVWSCSYPRHWSSDNLAVNVQQVPCRLDGLVNIRISPNSAYERTLTVRVAVPDTEPLRRHPVTFRLAFRQFTSDLETSDQIAPPIWSNPISLTIEP